MQFLKEFRRKDWAEARLVFQEMPEQRPATVVERGEQNQNPANAAKQSLTPQQHQNDMVRRFDQRVGTLNRDWQALMNSLGTQTTGQDRPAQGIVARLIDRRRSRA